MLIANCISKHHKASWHCISVFCSSLISICDSSCVSLYSLFTFMQMSDFGQIILLFCLFILFIMSYKLLLRSLYGVDVRSLKHKGSPFQNNMNLLCKDFQSIPTHVFYNSALRLIDIWFWATDSNQPCHVSMSIKITK